VSSLDWLAGPGCCPDPDPELLSLDEIDNDPDMVRFDDDAITGHGFDSRFTPVDTLMAGPLSMHLQHAHDMEHGDCC